MASKPILKRIRDVLMTNSTNEYDKNISEDEESNSDPDYLGAETESDDTSTDEHISKKDDSSDSDNTDDDTVINNQPESAEKNGVLWTTQTTAAHSRLYVINIMKKKPGAVTAVQTIMDAFKFFITDEILNEIVLQTNKYAKRYINQQKQRRSNGGASQSKLVQWKDLDRIELEAFLGLLIQSGICHSNHESIT
ncbi:unnamed protein product [Rotaria sordida]|uniref:PiggyBac transposable element-derived protein domain-containing protein n=1 Tax=Rotaria sordida TaxID=392033 RepID=A0A814ECN2_9BILA|nr:unnamed protein product [Rotaria sordida]CAF1510326.1 unnamed protein product [Rotaria sordida]